MFLGVPGLREISPAAGGSVHQCVGMDKRQILTLLRAEISSRISGSIHRRPQRRGINDEHTIPGRS
jgi:hypothetical protein